MEAKVNLHAPGSGRTTTQESLAGVFGIPECMPSIRRQIVKVSREEYHHAYRNETYL